MIFAKSEEEFNSLWNDMKTQLPGLGFEECIANDEKNIAEYAEAYKTAIEDSGK